MKMAWYFVQTLMGCIGSVGFAVLFNIRGRKLLLAAGGGALAWAVYLACTCNGLDIFAGMAKMFCWRRRLCLQFTCRRKRLCAHWAGPSRDAQGRLSFILLR